MTRSSVVSWVWFLNCKGSLSLKVLSLNLFGVTEENDRSGNGTVSLRSECRKVFPLTFPEGGEGSRDIALRFL
jgi:hypothetical protein